jgi:hypothetical protein
MEDGVVIIEDNLNPGMLKRPISDQAGSQGSASLAAARDPTGQREPPTFLALQSDVAQLSLEQQMERSQALAVEQLRALMEAYRSARLGGTR